MQTASQTAEAGPTNWYRDAFKTVGQIRAAAYRASEMLRRCGEFDLGPELHDSICRALPADRDTPTSVSLAATDLLEALSDLIEPYETMLNVELFERLEAPFATKLVTARAAIAKATGAAQ